MSERTKTSNVYEKYICVSLQFNFYVTKEDCSEHSRFYIILYSRIFTYNPARSPETILISVSKGLTYHPWINICKMWDQESHPPEKTILPRQMLRLERDTDKCKRPLAYLLLLLIHLNLFLSSNLIPINSLKISLIDYGWGYRRAI